MTARMLPCLALALHLLVLAMGWTPGVDGGAGYMGGGGMMGGGGGLMGGGGGMPGANCPNFWCGKKKVAVPSSKPSWKSSGCSSLSGGMMMFGGNSDDDVLSPCCDQRHACYQTCGMPKKKCDNLLKACMTARCAQMIPGKGKEGCESSQNIHSLSGDIGGCRMYDEAQRAACSCVSAKRAEKRRVDVLKGFYRVHNKAKLKGTALAELAKKKDTPKKFALLLNKLVAKYPASIKKVKDPRGSMDDILNNYKDKEATKDTNSEGQGGADTGAGAGAGAGAGDEPGSGGRGGRGGGEQEQSRSGGSGGSGGGRDDGPTPVTTEEDYGGSSRGGGGEGEDEEEAIDLDAEDDEEGQHREL